MLVSPFVADVSGLPNEPSRHRLLVPYNFTNPGALMDMHDNAGSKDDQATVARHSCPALP